MDRTLAPQALTQMKSAVQKSSIPESRIFVIRDLTEKHFDPEWHAHQEYQIFVVLKGTGTRFIGNTVKSFGEGDLTFLGPNVPHLWRSDEAYFDKHSDKHTHGIVIYFKETFLGNLLQKDEMSQVSSLFSRAQKGLEFYGKTEKEISGLMSELVFQHGIDSLVQLLKILDTLAHTKEYHQLHNEDYIYKLKEAETSRINIVYNYAAQYFKRRISLEEVAELLNMTPTSFSRYFTMKTSKSFSNFLIELRIKHACKLLSEQEQKNIAQICYECGFNTLSNFNRQFREYMKMTPKDYRKEFMTL